MFAELWASGELAAAAAITLRTLFVGYALAIAVGIPVGVVMGASERFGRVPQRYL